MKRAGIYTVALTAVGGLLALFAGGFSAFDFDRASGPPVDPAYASAPAGSPEKFAYLAQQQSNSCDLQPETVLGYADSKRLQGSCCSPMDMEQYQHQVEELQQYWSVDQIPRDPYNIPASQAKQLLGYRQELDLTAAEQGIYDEAMQLSREKGPCCCQCWRWYAFEGMSKYLIQEQDWDAPDLGRLIESVDGCGGSGDGHHAA